VQHDNQEDKEVDELSQGGIADAYQEYGAYYSHVIKGWGFVVHWSIKI
jgi:hypothetical protein